MYGIRKIISKQNNFKQKLVRIIKLVLIAIILNSKLGDCFNICIRILSCVFVDLV